MNILLILLMLSPLTGDRQTRGRRVTEHQAELQAQFEQIPWRQIEQWIIFENASQADVIRRLESGFGRPPIDEQVDIGAAGRPQIGAQTGWGRYFNPTYHGPKAAHIQRFHSIPDRKGGRSFGTETIVTAFHETCRDWTRRVNRYWQKWYDEQPPTLPCVLEELPEHKIVPKSTVVPHEPPPHTNIMDQMKAPPTPEVIDRGVRTTYNASDGRPAYQSQNSPGRHLVDGSVTLNGGEVIVDINTAVGSGRNDVSYQTVDSYRGSAWSTDTSNANSYTVYPLNGKQVLIKSSSGTDTSTVNFRLEGD